MRKPKPIYGVFLVGYKHESPSVWDGREGIQIADWPEGEHEYETWSEARAVAARLTLGAPSAVFHGRFVGMRRAI